MVEHRWKGLGDVSYYIGMIGQRVGRTAPEVDLIAARATADFVVDAIEKMGHPDELWNLEGLFQRLVVVMKTPRPLVRDVKPILDMCRAEWKQLTGVG